MTNKIQILLLLIVGSQLLNSCKKEVFIPSDESNPLSDWTTATHSNNVDPNYDVVFEAGVVNRIDLVFTADEWADMQTDLADVLSKSAGGPGGSFSDQTPLYFAADFFFNGKQWYNVGVRYKGNSSLESASKSNIGKLPLRLDFDRFETEFPEITNQRFYGFKELSLGNNFKDLSLMREKSACDLYRSFGVPAVQSTFVEIYIDRGNGAEYFGLYALNEIVFDTFLKNYFGSKTGNCYKPDGDGATFSTSGFTLDDFELKTNELAGDKSDVQALYNALQASSRTSNPTQWKKDLEAVFDVDGFLKYLAVNNTIQNWDTYGNMTHNYYLYNDPKDKRLKWIVWDNNEAFSSGGGRSTALSFGMSEVGTGWPLINYIIADASYLATYKAHIKSFVETTFTVDKMNTIYTDQQSLLTASATAEQSGYTFLNGVASFNTAVSTLKSHCSTRVSGANAFVN
ncbi:MAG: spore coat protein H [Bacteroidia bacterium]|jgi:spore coat protein H